MYVKSPVRREASPKLNVLNAASRGIDIVIPTYYHAPDSSAGSNRMRGPDEQTNAMFSYLSPEQRVRPDHPLRAIRRLVWRQPNVDHVGL